MSTEFPTQLSGANDLAKFGELEKLKHVPQFVWCLNAMSDKGAEQDVEKWWTWYGKFIELDLKNKAEGCDLDELNAHRFYEAFNNTHTGTDFFFEFFQCGETNFFIFFVSFYFFFWFDV